MRTAILVATIAGAGFLAWRRGLLVGVPGLPQPVFNHTDPGAADGLAFVPFPLPGATPMPTPMAAVARPTSGPRGIRNHNPGNIRRGDEWQGLDPNPSPPDDAFCVFLAPLWGLRALAKILRNYQARSGLLSVQEIIARWAPPSENNTSAYVGAVAAALHVDARVAIDLVAHPELLIGLMHAIVAHENGVDPYPSTLYSQAASLAR